MTLEEFEDRLNQNGSDFAAWPRVQADEARALLAKNADARTLMEEAAALDTMLGAPSPIRAPSGLANRIVAAAVTSPDAPALAGAHPQHVNASLTEAILGARPDVGAAQASALGWFRDLSALVFGTRNLLAPTAALTMCFAAGLAAGVLFSDQGLDASSYDMMASLFNYLKRS